ncbi:hypothetical protein [Cryobacterium sp. Y50]|uniref:hypothetical protein n=1 Tax=Cryobacterium sp. Y50 TaxID=2048286 RepID=UPI000CE30E99|nr:hypothetical protein [Cryobacterium sp. Y50]
MANLSAWEAVLEDLELRVDAAARSITGVTDGGRAGSVSGVAVSAGSTNDMWVVPRGLGAIPAQLAERVRDLLQNQQKLIGELETARNLTAKHLAAVRAVPPKRDARASVYLDVDG